MANRKPLTDRDGEVRELTKADFARAIRFDQLPQEHQNILSSRRRGPQKTPTKQRVTLRLSPEVVKHYKATGPGWQTRIDRSLLEVIGVNNTVSKAKRARTPVPRAKSRGTKVRAA